VPETALMEEAWSKLRLTVQISTKLNRSHLIHGDVSFLLPCLGRIEIDEQRSGSQAVSVEDSTAFIHGSKGVAAPASPHLLSEPKIIAELAKATLPPNPKVNWDAWVDNYDSIRDAIEHTYPDIFRDFNGRMFRPGGFARPLSARNRQWKTETGKANFIVPSGLQANPDAPPDGEDVLQLITLRSNDQFNTTIYSDNDRYRGVTGTRRVLFMNPQDIDRLGFTEGAVVNLTTAVEDGVLREVHGLRVVAYDIPMGCCGGYYPECNRLVPLWHHADRAKVPAFKSIPIRIRQATDSARA
jgi:molybdopterin-dependent oxidoreductase alpha subunit